MVDIGEMGSSYIDSVVTCLEDALTDRDPVHRQTASAIVKHLALGVAGLGHEDALLHLMNLVWPNVLETSPHVLQNVMDAIEAMRVSLGPGVVLSYVLQGGSNDVLYCFSSRTHQPVYRRLIPPGEACAGGVLADLCELIREGPNDAPC